MGQIGVLVISVFFVLFVSCQNKATQNQENVQSDILLVPTFSSDSAYYYIQNQVDFGPRVPDTKGHQDCYNYLVDSFEGFGANVITQSDIVKRYDGVSMTMKNIIASYNLDADKRVLLCAHWDTRFIADNDSVDINKPIDGANDGGSGVGVLLEIARQINLNPINLGIDIVLFDVEDQGQPNDYVNFVPDSWCLGSQYWSLKPHIENYYAEFGVLLDMVGGRGATFTKEYTSNKFAPRILDNIWAKAHEIGFSEYFLYEETPAIIDDHLYINHLIHIPTVNIVEYDRNSHNKFNAHHHKHSDNMDIIDKKTLDAVGQTLLEVLYSYN